MTTCSVPRRAARRFDSPQQEAFLNLWRTYDRLKLIEERLFNEHGLSAQQYNAMRLLRAGEPRGLPTLVLAQRLISRAPDVTRLIDKLEGLGFVERHRPSDNRRTVSIRITPDGRRKLDELKGEVRRMHQEQLGHMKAADLSELLRLLKLARSPHEDDTCNWLDEA